MKKTSLYTEMLSISGSHAPVVCARHDERHGRRDGRRSRRSSAWRRTARSPRRPCCLPMWAARSARRAAQPPRHRAAAGGKATATGGTVAVVPGNERHGRRCDRAARRGGRHGSHGRRHSPNVGWGAPPPGQATDTGPAAWRTRRARPEGGTKSPGKWNKNILFSIFSVFSLVL